MARQIAFLRAITLASNRRVSVGDLRKLLTDLVYEDVREVLELAGQQRDGTKSSQFVTHRHERAL
jgi:hypothetical protein